MGLQPRAVSRDLDWGIPVPVEGADGKVLYVWFDAPIGYISNTIDLVGDDYTKWWKDPETRMLHFIGKDNIVFHCIVFPAMLMADGSYNLPDNVPANVGEIFVSGPGNVHRFFQSLAEFEVVEVLAQSCHRFLYFAYRLFVDCLQFAACRHFAFEIFVVKNHCAVHEVAENGNDW